MAKEKQLKEVMESVKVFLDDNKIAYWESHLSKRCGVNIPLVIPKYQIAIQLGDDQDWFNKVRRIYRPIFIRSLDTKELAVEKVQNTIITIMTQKQRKIIREEERRKRYEEHLRKREYWHKRREREKRKRIASVENGMGGRHYEKAKRESNISRKACFENTEPI